MRKYAIIVAGGEGNRAGGSVPKQFRKICGIPMLWWSVRAFYEADPSTTVILVLHPGFFDDWDILYSELPEEDRRIPVLISCGGRNRLESVRNGLMSVPHGEAALVAVHDAARPLVTAAMISLGWKTAAEHLTAVPVTDMTDSLRRVSGPEGSESVPRKEYVKVQTPQVFDASILKSAYSATLDDTMTDDASVVERSGTGIRLYKGDPDNFKVTNPSDIAIADLLIALRMERE